MTDHQLTDSDDGSVVRAGIGDLVEVRLPERASGGYRWTVASPPSGVLEPLEPMYEFAEGRVGGTSVARFRFQAESGGTAKVRLEYKRPWEAEEPPLHRYEFSIVVEP